MDAIAHAKEILAHYPALRWLPTTQGFRWEAQGARVVISPEDGGSIAEKHGAHFPVVVEGDRVSLPAFGITHYPDAHHRTRLADGPNAAMVFVCNRFLGPGGHSYLYLHYPAHPADDRIINFNAGANPLGKFGIKRFADFVHRSADGITEAEMRGATSFAGFPVTERQARVIEADAIFTMIHPHHQLYSLFNLEGLNCLGFSLSMLHNVHENIGQLSGKPGTITTALGHFARTWPENVHNRIHRMIGGADEHAALRICHDGADCTHAYSTLRLARSPDGLLLGETMGSTRPHPSRDKYIAHDMVKLMDHLLPRVLNERAEVMPLAGLALPEVTAAPLNEKQRSVLPTGMSRSSR